MSDPTVNPNSSSQPESTVPTMEQAMVRNDASETGPIQQNDPGSDETEQAELYDEEQPEEDSDENDFVDEEGVEPDAQGDASENGGDSDNESAGVAGGLGVSEDELDELRANEVAYSWDASEFVQHHKGVGWYLALFGILISLIAGAALLQLWLAIGLFLVMGAAIVVYARKPPRTLTYELTPKGITIDSKEFAFSEFRSFGLVPDTDWHTIDLEPVKRFSPRMTVLFDDDDLESIVSHLELHLPRVDRQPDIIERLSRYLRF